MSDIYPKIVEHRVFEYLYRDGGNWKTWGEILLSGCFPSAVYADLLSCLETDGLFVAEQLGVKSLCYRHFETYGGPTELDHAYHEFHDLREATSDEIASMSVDDSIENFMARLHAINGNWNVLFSPNALLPPMRSGHLWI